MLYLDLFTKDYIDRSPTQGTVTPSDLNYLRRLYIFNKDAIHNYYKDRNFAVKNTHLLSRLLEHFPFYGSYDDYRYIDFSLGKLTYLAKHFKLTSSIEKGVIHHGVFYGDTNEEIIIASYENFDVQKALKEWKDIKSVYTLQHHRDDMNILLPLGKPNCGKEGLCTMMVNIPLLALQYRQFVKKHYVTDSLNGDENQIRLSKNHFVIKYVLSNMMDDAIDHMLLNKVMNKFYGIEETEPKVHHRFKIYEPITQVNRYVNQTLDVLTSKHLDYIMALKNIKLIFNEDASQLLALPDISLTNQVKWAIISCRIDYMIFLYDVCKNKDGKNGHFINDWKRLAKRALRDNLFTGLFSYESENNLKDKLYKLTQF